MRPLKIPRVCFVKSYIDIGKAIPNCDEVFIYSEKKKLCWTYMSLYVRPGPMNFVFYVPDICSLYQALLYNIVLQVKIKLHIFYSIIGLCLML